MNCLYPLCTGLCGLRCQQRRRVQQTDFSIQPGIGSNSRSSHQYAGPWTPPLGRSVGPWFRDKTDKTMKRLPITLSVAAAGFLALGVAGCTDAGPSHQHSHAEGHEDHEDHELAPAASPMAKPAAPTESTPAVVGSPAYGSDTKPSDLTEGSDSKADAPGEGSDTKAAAPPSGSDTKPTPEGSSIK